MTKKSGKPGKIPHFKRNETPTTSTVKGTNTSSSDIVANKENSSDDHRHNKEELKPSSQPLKRQQHSSRMDKKNISRQGQPKQQGFELKDSRNGNRLTSTTLSDRSNPNTIKVIPLQDLQDSNFYRLIDTSNNGNLHYRCYLCSRSQVSQFDWDRHLKSKQHQTKIETIHTIQEEQKSSKADDHNNTENCNTFSWMRAFMIDNFCSPVEIKKDSGNENNCCVKWTCTLCYNDSSNRVQSVASRNSRSEVNTTWINTTDVLAHCSGKGHVQAMRLYKEHRTIHDYTVSEKERFQFLRIDQKDGSVSSSVIENMDVSTALQANLGVKQYNYKCTLCSASGMSAKSVIDHFLGKIHTSKFERWMREQQDVDSVPEMTSPPTDKSQSPKSAIITSSNNLVDTVSTKTINEPKQGSIVDISMTESQNGPEHQEESDKNNVVDKTNKTENASDYNNTDLPTQSSLVDAVEWALIPAATVEQHPTSIDENIETNDVVDLSNAIDGSFTKMTGEDSILSPCDSLAGIPIPDVDSSGDDVVTDNVDSSTVLATNDFSRQSILEPSNNKAIATEPPIHVSHDDDQTEVQNECQSQLDGTFGSVARGATPLPKETSREDASLVVNEENGREDRSAAFQETEDTTCYIPKSPMEGMKRHALAMEPDESNHLPKQPRLLSSFTFPDGNCEVEKLDKVMNTSTDKTQEDTNCSMNKSDGTEGEELQEVNKAFSTTEDSTAEQFVPHDTTINRKGAIEDSLIKENSCNQGNSEELNQSSNGIVVDKCEINVVVEALDTSIAFVGEIDETEVCNEIDESFAPLSFKEKSLLEGGSGISQSDNNFSLSFNENQLLEGASGKCKIDDNEALHCEDIPLLNADSVSHIDDNLCSHENGTSFYPESFQQRNPNVEDSSIKDLPVKVLEQEKPRQETIPEEQAFGVADEKENALKCLQELSFFSFY